MKDSNIGKADGSCPYCGPFVDCGACEETIRRQAALGFCIHHGTHHCPHCSAPRPPFGADSSVGKDEP